MPLDFIISAYASLSVKIHIILFTTANKTVSLTLFQLIRTRSRDGYPVFKLDYTARPRPFSRYSVTSIARGPYCVALFHRKPGRTRKTIGFPVLPNDDGIFRLWDDFRKNRLRSKKRFDYALCVHPRGWRFKFSKEERDTIRGSFRQAERQYRETQAADSQQARRVSK